MKTLEQLQGEIRYAIRLCQRTARLYRRIQTTGVFLAVVGGGGTASLLSTLIPAWVGLTGTALLALAGAALIAIRPGDKAALNEADIRRYQALMIKSHSMDAEQLTIALAEAHQGDAPEIDPLRVVAFNDVALEINRPDVVVPLRPMQKILAALA